MGIHENDIDISYVCLQHPINDVNKRYVSKFIISLRARKYNSNKELEKRISIKERDSISDCTPIPDFNVSALPIQANRELDAGSPPCRPDEWGSNCQPI